MAPHEFVEIRLVCQADYLDPKLKLKLHEIKDKLREILHTGRRRFALKKVQPWNSVKVTFDIPKEAAERLHLLAIQGNVRLIELGILSVEIVGQSNAIVVNNNTNNVSTTATTTTTTTAAAITTDPTTNSKDLSVPSSSSSILKPPNDSLESSVPPPSTINITSEDHRHKRVKLENENDPQTFNFPYKSSTTVNLMQPSSTSGHPVSHYLPPQTTPVIHRQSSAPPHTLTNNYGRLSHPNSISSTHNTYINSGKPSISVPSPHPPPPSNLYQSSSIIDNTNSTLSNGIGNDMHNYHHHESWPSYIDHSNNYKMKVNGVRPNHYYPQQQQLTLPDGSSTSPTIYCTPSQTQYDMRRCETTMPQMTSSTTNIQNSYDGSSTGLSS
ncbi:hypothetical protein I4U23_018352 [Adineta vaga]|nr:hypothetical protein I4U23_018352 [Adineta vaga]